MKALVWPVATYGCESWTLRKNEETRVDHGSGPSAGMVGSGPEKSDPWSTLQKTRLDAFEMKGLRKILRVSWTAKKTNEWVLSKAEVKRELLDTVKAMKLAYCYRGYLWVW